MNKKQTIQENENKEKNLEVLYERRNVLDAARAKHSDFLDKYLLTFATGSLYLSITFTSSLDQDLDSRFWLSRGWILLLLSIITILISFYCGEKAHAKQIEINDNQMNKVFEGGDISDVCTANIWNPMIELLKMISVITFILGISFLTYFYFINL